MLRAIAFACAILFAHLPALAQGTQEVVPPKSTALPSDVHADSRSRLPLVKREQMNDAGKAAYDAVVDPKSRLKAEIVGPAGIWLHIPTLSPHIREVNWTLRNKTSLDNKFAELVILVTARENDGQSEWTSHEPAALKAGLDQKVVDAIKYRKPIDDLPKAERTVIQLGRELFQNRKLSQATYASAIEQFGQNTVVDIVMLMANYTMTSVILQAFDQQLRPDLTPLLPVKQPN